MVQENYSKLLLPSAGPFVRTISRRKRGSVRRATGDTFPLTQTEVAAAGMEARVLIETFRSMPTQAKCSPCLAISVDRALNQTCRRIWVQRLFGNSTLWRHQTEEGIWHRCLFLSVPVTKTAETMAHIILCNGSPPFPGFTESRENEKVTERC